MHPAIGKYPGLGAIFLKGDYGIKKFIQQAEWQ
jgi:hypothetical protein